MKLIYAEQAIRKIMERADKVIEFSPYWEGLMFCKNTLNKLPSIQPERGGRWIVRYECPNCGEERGYAFDVCPMCGADMRGEQE